MGNLFQHQDGDVILQESISTMGYLLLYRVNASSSYLENSFCARQGLRWFRTNCFSIYNSVNISVTDQLRGLRQNNETTTRHTMMRRSYIYKVGSWMERPAFALTQYTSMMSGFVACVSALPLKSVRRLTKCPSFAPCHISNGFSSLKERL